MADDIRVKLSPEGLKDVVNALRTVRAEAELAARGSSAAFKPAAASITAMLTPLNALRAALPALGLAATAAGLVALGKGAVSFADGIGKAAERVGTTAENFSTLAFAAKTADVGVDGLETSLGILAKNVSGLKNGTSSAADSLAELGLSASDFIGLDTAQAFELISKRMAGVKDGGDRARLSLDTLGRSGRQLLPVMRDVAENGLGALTEQAKQFGAFVSTDTSSAVQQFNDNVTKLGESSQSLARQQVARLLPGLNDITKAMIEAAKEGGILKAVWVGLGGIASQVFKGSELSQAQEAVADAQALVDQSRALIESGKQKIPFLPFSIELDQEHLVAAKKILVDREAAVKDAQARLDDLTKHKDSEGVDGSDAAFDAAKRIADLTKELKLDQLKNSETVATRQRALTEEQIKLDQSLLEAKQTTLAGQQAADRAAITSITARAVMEKRAYADEIAQINLRDDAIRTSIQKEITALNASGKSTGQQQQVLAELTRQSLNERLIATQGYYSKLQALAADYIAKYKSASDAIKSIDQEIADNRSKLNADSVDLASNLQGDKRISALQNQGNELLSKESSALLHGNIEDAKKYRDAVLQIRDALKEAGATQFAAEFGQSAISMIDIYLLKQKEALLATQRLAEEGQKQVSGVLAKAGDEIKTLFSQQLGTIDVKFAADRAALTAMVNDIRDTLGKEVFTVNVTPNLTGATGGSAPALARGGRIPGSPSTVDNVMAFLASGEYVVRAPAVQRYGSEYLDAINNMQLPKFAEGGLVGVAPASGPSDGQVHHVEWSLNKGTTRRLSGSRDAVQELVQALQEVARGT